eukprot:1172312-Prorocentrum_minimum.AAC.1
MAGPHIALTGMPWSVRGKSRKPGDIAVEVSDLLLTKAGFRLAKGQGRGVFVPKTDFREYATAM